MLSNIITQEERTIKRNYWLIKLRWFAIGGIGAVIVLTYFLSFNLCYKSIFLVFFGLIIHNYLSLLLLKKAERKGKNNMVKYIEKIMFYQILIDLIILTIIIHFFGGFENPFLFFYSFHVVLAAILLPKKTSYLVAFIEVSLVLSLAFLEYHHVLPHFSHGFYDYASNDLTFSISVLFIFALSLFILVYLVSNIAEKLKAQEKELIGLAQELADKNEELNRKDAVKNEYVLRVTHDIKGHLAAIISNLGVLENGYVGEIDPKQKKFVSIAHKRTNVLTEFVQDLLRLTQMRLSNKSEIHEINMNELINKTIDKIKSNADDKNINIDIQSDETLMAKANSFSIEEVISNLTLNAVKYTPESGKISITLKKESQFAAVSIKDTGIGIPKDDLPNIFNEFYRAKNAKQSKFEGTGLGLSLVKQMIEQNKGEIFAESKEGEGSTFTFKIPLA